MKPGWIAFIVCLAAAGAFAQAQDRTLGVVSHDNRAWDGYTLFSPKHYTSTYLINNEGRIVHSWAGSRYEPGQSVYLLENGHLLRACMTKGQLSSGGGEGGRIEEYDWDGNLVWEFNYSSATYMQHHDICPLPNGNILMLAIEPKTYSEVIAAGFNPNMLQPDVLKDGMLPDFVAEVKPVLPSSGTIVWEWHVWDHLIQDIDASKANYGVVKDHPELIGTAGDKKRLPVFWNHMNSIDYHAGFDQIAMSVRGNSEVWIIDHSTTTVEASGHAGGIRGKGGDLLYRWGNPQAYNAGAAADEMLYQQHHASWIPDGYPGAGNMTFFNNGLARSYSSADEITLPVDANGNYSRTPGAAFGPTSLTWTWHATPPESMYSEAISGVQRLPNGNTLICDGVHGRFIEVTSGGDVVWEYVCPVVKEGPLVQGAVPELDERGHQLNAVFRVERLPKDYPAFAGRDLTPGDFVERYATSVQDPAGMSDAGFELYQNYPNPFRDNTTVPFWSPVAQSYTLSVYNTLGIEVQSVRNVAIPGINNIALEPLSPGMYLYVLRTSNTVLSRTMTAR